MARNLESFELFAVSGILCWASIGSDGVGQRRRGRKSLSVDYVYSVGVVDEDVDDRTSVKN